MSRQVVQNLLQTTLTGLVSANFPGGVSMLASDILDIGVDDRHVTWRRRVGGTTVASIGAQDLAGAASYLNLAAVTAPQSPFGAAVQALITNPAGSELWGVDVIDSKGASDFFRYITAASGTLGGILGTPVVNPWSGLGFVLPGFTRTLAIGMTVSGYCTGVGAVEWELAVDGISRANSAFYFNNSNVHQSLGWNFVVLTNVAAGFHTLTAVNPASTLSVDGNDNCAYVIVA